jgi:hypothetical protein
MKVRVARQAFGTALVPEWERGLAEISSELAAVYTDLVNSYGRALDSLDVAESTAGRAQLLQQALLWARLGLFPGDPEKDLRPQLIDASRELWTRRGGVGVIMSVQERHGRDIYVLAGADTISSATARP